MNTCPYPVGTKVECNGYPGTITRICEWSGSMIEVRVPGGVTCVDYHEVIKPLDARDAKVWKRLMRDRDARLARAIRLHRARS